jgi:lathosterol oxidase
LLIPIHPLTIILFTVIGFMINVYGHLGYEIAPRWLRGSFLFEVVNTSVHHNLHHSKFKGNYGLYFRVWDRLMGTEHPDYVKDYDRVQQNRFGVDEKVTTMPPSSVSIND